ncbi:MAG: glycosyltransferase [Fimbriimonas ginsengisoli]|uniref:Glycosyltransferase n=1 Tax=Fimbriimonas ginsengisoli TaxID=1005039 RepID=A0A931PVT1_FIMGI|nr:glycosyltransferase [Fimbriimonas ginsengisoli]
MSRRPCGDRTALRALAERHDYGALRASVEPLLKRDPNDPEFNALYGLALCYAQREDEALAYLTRAMSAGHAPSKTGASSRKHLHPAHSRHLPPALQGEGRAGRVPSCPSEIPEIARVGQILIDHFHCRAVMAKGLKQPDPKGDRLLAEAKRLTGLTPGKVGVELCACLIVRDEERNLGRCLASLKGLVDRIVVVDTGSTDRTVEIATKHGATIGHFEWCDDFAAARNAALDLATGDWALWIDADEELPAESHGTIRAALIRPHYASFNVPIVNFMGAKGEAEQFVHAPTRLFRRLPGARFTGRIHEQIAQSLVPSGLPVATLEAARLLHHGYRPEAIAAKDKLGRDLALLWAEVRERPEDSFQWFNLANALSIAGRHSEADQAARSSIRTLVGAEAHAASAHQVLVVALEAQGKLEAALVAADDAERAGGVPVVIAFDRASVLFKLGRLAEALAQIEICLGLEWPAGATGDRGLVTYKRDVLQGQILAAAGRFDEALGALEKALGAHPGCAAARFARAGVLERLDRLAEAQAAYLETAEAPGLGAASMVGAARCALGRGNRVEALALHEKAWRLNPDDLAVWALWEQAATGDPATALAPYETYAAEREPNVEMLINWGRTLDTCGQSAPALVCYSEAIRRAPDSANALFNCGDLLYRLGEYMDAAQLYEKGLRNEPLNPQGWFVLGNTLARLGVAQGARLAYGQCLSLRPTHAEARNNLDWLAEAFPEAA